MIDHTGKKLIDIVFFSDLFPCGTYVLNHEMTLSLYHVLLNYTISILGRGHMMYLAYLSTNLFS